MLRDTRRDVSYFNRMVSFYKNVHKKNITQLPDLELSEGIGICVDRIFVDSIKICILEYGRGDDTHSIKDDIEIIIFSRKTLVNELSSRADKDTQEMYTRLDLYTYYNILTWLCFLVHIKSDSSTFKDIFKLISNFQNDSIFTHLYELLTGETVVIEGDSKLAYPKTYTKLLDVFYATEETRAILMKKFVENWYKYIRPIAWHGNDKAAEGAYFGYWCFEAALVVNLLNIDDSSFRDNVYYPKDLVIRN